MTTSLPQHPYAVVAQTLGMVIMPHRSGSLSLRGTVDGQAMSVQRPAGSGPVVVHAALLPALDLGLRVAPAGMADGLKDLLGAVDIDVGVPGFDAAYAVRADEPDRARLLLAGAAAEAIAACAPLAITMRDGSVEARLTREEVEAGDGAVLAGAITTVAAIARIVDAARTAVPPAAPLAHLADAWTAFARERGLTAHVDAPMSLCGPLHDARVCVASKRVRKDVHEVEVGVLFERPLDFQLQIGPERDGVATWFEPEDVTLGDTAFDQRFDVRTDDAERARALLDVNVRATLIELATGPRLSMTSYGIFVTDDALHFAPATIPMTVDLVAGLARDVVRLAESAAVQGTGAAAPVTDPAPSTDAVSGTVPSLDAAVPSTDAVPG